MEITEEKVNELLNIKDVEDFTEEELFEEYRKILAFKIEKR